MEPEQICSLYGHLVFFFRERYRWPEPKPNLTLATIVFPQSGHGISLVRMAVKPIKTRLAANTTIPHPTVDHQMAGSTPSFLNSKPNANIETPASYNNIKVIRWYTL